MGFDEVYRRQTAVLTNIKNEVNQLESVIGKIKNIVGDMNSAWPYDAGEKYYITMALQKARINIGKQIRNFRTFTLTSFEYLKQMREFERYKGTLIQGVCNVGEVVAHHSKKSRIVCDTVKLKQVAAQVENAANTITKETDVIGTYIRSVDNDIVIKVLGGSYRLNKYKNNLSNEAKHLRQIAKVIRQIADNYEKLESNIEKEIISLGNINVNAGELADVISDTFSDDLNTITNEMNKPNNGYTEEQIKQLLENLKKIHGRADDYVDDLNKIKTLLETLTGDKLDVPYLSNAVDLYNQVKGEYKSAEEFLDALSSGKLFDGLKDPNTWANILKEGGNMVFGKLVPAFPYLAGAASYVTTVWGEELQELYKEGRDTGNAISDSFTLWSGVGEHIMNDMVTNSEKIVVDGFGAVYDIADNLSEDFLQVDLDKEFGKLGVNVRDRINDFSVGKLTKDAGKVVSSGYKKVQSVVAAWL